MPIADPLATDIQRDIVAFKRHLNPLLRPLEEAVERQRLAVPAAPPSPLFSPEAARIACAYIALCVRPFAPEAWLRFWAAGAALQFAATQSILR